MRKSTALWALALLIGFAVSAPAFAKSSTHYSYQGGSYKGGKGSSHKGGHYVSRRTGNRYTHHKN